MKAGYGKTVRPVCAADGGKLFIGRLLRPDSYDIPVLVNNINKEIYVPAHHRAEILSKQLSVPTRRIIIGQIKAVWVPNRPAVPNVKSIRWHFVATTRRELKFRMHHSYDCSPQHGGETGNQQKKSPPERPRTGRDGHPSGRSAQSY